MEEMINEVLRRRLQNFDIHPGLIRNTTMDITQEIKKSYRKYLTSEKNCQSWDWLDWLKNGGD